LQQAAYKLAEEVYKQSADQQQPGAEGAGGTDGAEGAGDQSQQGPSGDDNVEDADFEVVDD